MKTITILLMMISFNSNSQKQISYVSQNKDTLILPNNNLGYSILGIWDKIPESERPKILFASEWTIAVKNRKLFKKEEQIQN